MLGWFRATGLGVIAGLAGIVAACGSNSSNPGGPSSSGSSGGGASSGGSSGSSSGGFNFGDGSVAGDGGMLGDAGCATATAKAMKTPVYMVFILDGSDSMKQNNKWTAATQALETIFADVQTQADPGMDLGLIVFSDSQDTTGGHGPYPVANVNVPINLVSAAQVSALNHRLTGQPGPGTPTGIAITGGYGELASYTPMAPIPPGGQKVVVLITDGVPTDKCSLSLSEIQNNDYSSNACILQAGQELTAAPPQGPVLTFVIGTGVFPSPDPLGLLNFDPKFLGTLAQAGGTGPKGCNPTENSTTSDLCYLEVDPTKGSATQTEQAFEAAINAIRGQVISCTFPLNIDSEAGTLDPTKVNVTVDGQTIPQSPTSGWSYNDPQHPSQIVFNGQACTNLKNDPKADVQIVLGCVTVTAQ